MALKKYRFFVGACGPTMMYSNIIRAEDEVSAAKLYLTEQGEEASDEAVAEQLRFIREVVPKETPEKLFDFMNKEISVDDDVMFIRNSSSKAPKLMPGKVEKITGKSVVIKTPAGESVRVILAEDEEDSIARIIVMSPRPERAAEGVVDASEYPLLEGDPVVYMKAIAYNRCEGFDVGTVEKISGKSLEVNGTRRTPERVVVINW